MWNLFLLCFTMAGLACTNTCPYHHDNECDDGRVNASSSICRYGTDCADCGATVTLTATPSRPTQYPTKRPITKKPTRYNGPGLCLNNCLFARDGFCDDGGEGSQTPWCFKGTDCADCGKRPFYPTRYASPKPTIKRQRGLRGKYE